MHLNITENIFAGSEIARWGLLQRKEMRRQTENVLRYLKSDLAPDMRMSDLTSGQQKIVEIAKALVSKSNVIILDEPTASFSSREIDTVLNIVKTVKEDGIGVIYISHHLDEVFEIGDRATVLRDGRKVSMYPIAGLTKTTLIKDMVGRDPSTFYKRERVERGEVVLEVRNVTGNGVRNVSFDLHRGEVLGIAGMVGSGRSELMEVLFGSAPLVYGEIAINGRSVKHSSPKSAIRNKMCFITEDRQTTGLFLPKTIAENVAVANMVNTRQFVAWPSNDVLTGEKYVKLLNIKAPSAQHTGRQSLGRQPAEGGAGQVVQHRRRDLPLRRAVARNRRRLQTGNLQGHGRPAEGGQGDPHGLLRHAGGDLDERSRDRLQARRDRRRAGRRGDYRRKHPHPFDR